MMTRLSVPASDPLRHAPRSWRSDAYDYLRSLGAVPVAYGRGLADWLRAVAPDGIDAALGSEVDGLRAALEVTRDPGSPPPKITLGRPVNQTLSMRTRLITQRRPRRRPPNPRPRLRRRASRSTTCADLLIRGLRADQRRVVGWNVRLAEPTDGRDVVMLSIPHDRFGARRHRTLPQRTTPDLALTRLGQQRHQALSAERSSIGVVV